MEIENKKFRCHGSIVLEKTGKILMWLLFLIVVNFGDAFVEEDIPTDEKWIGAWGIIIILLVVMALTLGVAILRWRKTTITIEDDAIIWDRNTLNRKTLTIGIRSISSINIERNIFERVIGTAKLKLDTDSLSTADATDVEFVFKYDDAVGYKEYLEKKVRASAGEQEYNGESLIASDKVSSYVQLEASDEVNSCVQLKVSDKWDAVEESEYGNEYIAREDKLQAQYVSDFGEIASHCLYDLTISSLFIGLPFIIFGIIGLVAMLMDGELGIEDIFASILQIVAFGYATIYAVIGKFFTYYNLTVARQGNRIYMKYGMFKVREYVLPVEKINAIHIKQTLVGRIFKRYNVSMECVGVGDNEKEIAQLTLSLKLDEIKERMAVLLPEYDIDQLDIVKPIEKKAIWHKLSRLVWVIFFATCVNVGIYIGMNVIDDFGIAPTDMTFWMVDGIIIGVILLWILVYALLQLGVEAVGFGHKHLITVTGACGKDIAIISYRKIQYVSTRKSPISNLSGLARGYVNILSGMLGTTKNVPYMNENDVNTLGERVCNR